MRAVLAEDGLAPDRDGARRSLLRVLVYHRVHDSARAVWGDPHLHSATPEAFDAQMAYLTRRYTPVTATEVAAAVRGEVPLPRRAVLVTFDDAYRDFLIHAWPVLRRHRVPALLFVPTAFLGADRGFWWDDLYESVMRTEALAVQVGSRILLLRTRDERHAAARILIRSLRALRPDELSARLGRLRNQLGAPERGERQVLTWEELRGLVAEGLAVGAHTRTHPPLPSLAQDELEHELRGAHADLQRELGQAPVMFAYTFGLADQRVVPILRELGYAGAFISLYGRNRVSERDPFLLYRQSVDLHHSMPRFALSLTVPYLGARESGRALRQRVRNGLSWLTSLR